ncbi:MAG: hypothetical protein HY675_05480 [Chloroflexi bacterium]|nr:hypothetical protein [Chloroflexota bacterium]
MVSVTATQNDSLARFGFGFGRGGAHLARTMMLSELDALLAYVGRPDASKADYRRAIEEENCLGKRSGRTRGLTYGHLVDLYSLDPAVTLFSALLFFWRRDPTGRRLLALLCAYGRDRVLRLSAPFILEFPEGATVTRQALEEHLERCEHGRFSKVTLEATAQRINSTWTQSGHLIGRAHKMRSRAIPTPGAVAYALLLGYLAGVRGEQLFRTEYAKLLDCSYERAIELAEDASRRGWIVFKRVGNVIEVLFPNVLREHEMEWVREQG